MSEQRKECKHTRNGGTVQAQGKSMVCTVCYKTIGFECFRCNGRGVEREYHEESGTHSDIICEVCLGVGWILDNP
jgi:hypothetical protein